MSLLQNVDTALFVLVNQRLQNPVFDRIMPWLSGNPLFIPALIALAVGLVWKGGRRGRLFVGMLLIVVALGDGMLINTLKQSFGRIRPFAALEGVNLLVGKGGSGSFPSSHSSTWAAATMLTLVYYPRVWHWVFLAMCSVAFSRVYVGVHYPSDVLGGLLLGAGYAVGFLFLLNHGWRALSQRWMPELAERLPSLIPEATDAAPRPAPRPVSSETWVRLGYLVILLFALMRWSYLAAGKIELSEDEAYQWIWSKHPALSYFSKPPMITWLHMLGTSIFGDTPFGSRFAAPLMSGFLSLVLLRFIARVTDGFVAFLVVLGLNAIPLLAVGSILITVDPPMVLFWTLGMVLGWRAAQPDGTTGQWCATGLCIGLSALAKYAGLYQLLCWCLFFVLWPAARPHLRRPGPWLAVLIAVACLTPVAIWNTQHSWVTVDHVRFNASRSTPWTPSLRFFWDFLGAHAGLWNPVFFLLALAGMGRFHRIQSAPALSRFLFCMGAPVFLGYLGFTAYKRVFANWTAPSVIPLMLLAALFAWDRWKLGRAWPRRVLIGGLALGLPFSILLHDTRLVGKLTGKPLPVSLDPMRRVQGWKAMALAVEEARQDLAKEGKPTFVIAGHYGLTSELTYYIPEARRTVAFDPFVFYRTAPSPQNQFYFWPGYSGHRKGQNAIFMQEVDIPDEAESLPESEQGARAAQAAPEEILREFRSVTSLGVHPVRHEGRVVRWMQMYACRTLL